MRAYLVDKHYYLGMLVAAGSVFIRATKSMFPQQ